MDGVFKWHSMSYILALVLLWLGAAAGSEATRLGQAISDHVRDAKRDLAQSFLKTQLRNRDSVSVSRGFTWKLGTLEGSVSSTFRSFNQSFIVVGRVLYRLREAEGEELSLSTEAVGEFKEFLGDVVFIESAAFDGLILVLAGYRQGLMQLFTVDQNNTMELRQTIDAYGVPTDAEFFVQDEKLYVVVAASNDTSPNVPLVIYRWYGTHLDEEDRLLLTAPVAVSTFQYEQSVVIVVALRASGAQKAGLAVLRRTSAKLVMVHYLPASGPMAMQHFVFKSENYLLVRNYDETSIIVWWSGAGLTVWASLEGAGAFHSVGVGYVRDETILLLSEKSVVKIYRPSEGSLQLLDVLNMNSSVQSATLYIRDQSLYLVALTQSAAGSLVPSVLELRLVFMPVSVSHAQMNEDPIYNCLVQLRQALSDQRSILDSVNIERGRLLRTDVSGVFTGKLVVQKLNISKSSIGKVVPQSSPTISAFQLKDLINQASTRAESLKADFTDVVLRDDESVIIGSKLIANELEIHDASIDSVSIKELNGQPFNPSNLLRHSKTQKIAGIISVDKIVVDSLYVSTLNGHILTDLLRRRGNQAVVGLREVPNLSTAYVHLTDTKVINDIWLNEIVTVKTPSFTPITGIKTFPGLSLENLAVELLNNVNFTDWIQSLRPQTPMEVNVAVESPVLLKQPQTISHKGDLKLVNLTVEGKVNDIKFDDLLSALFLRGINQNISGDVTFTGLPIVRKLTATKANGVKTNVLLTKTTDQVIYGNISLNSLRAADLIADNINGLKISKDAAYVNSPVPISSPVAFRKMQSRELKLPPHATIQGQQIGRRLLHQPLIKYERKVTVKGNIKLTDINLEQRQFVHNGQLVTLRDLPRLYWTKSSKQVIKVPVVAKGGVVAKSLKADTVNGINPASYVNLHTTQVLRGQWTFDSASIFGNLTHAPFAFQAPISPSALAASVVRTTGNYSIHGNMTFLGGLITNELNADSLDNIKISDVLGQGLSRGGPYPEINIKGDMFVRSDVLLNNTLNQIHVCDRLSRAVLKDSEGISIVPSVSISAVTAATMNVHTLNGSPHTVWYVPNRSGMPTKRAKSVKIKGNVRVPELLDVMRVNNKPVTREYLARVVDRSVKGVIRGKKTFVGQMIVHGEFRAAHYSGVDLQDVENKCLSKTRPQWINYPVTMAEMHSTALTAELVNNIPMRSLLSADQFGRQTIVGDVVFTKNVNVMGLLDVADFENGCDLNMVAESLRVLDGRRWASITVSGDLAWSRSLPDRKTGLGYYMNSAVTKHGSQVIVGDVYFGGTVHTNNVYSEMDINDVDIAGIMRDSLRKSASDQVVSGVKLFQHKLFTSSLRVDGNVVAKKVQDVDVQHLNRSLVRVMGDRVVRGHKRFLQGFKANMLKVDGLFNGIPTSNIVTYDMPILPTLLFHNSLEVMGDLTFTDVNNFGLFDFLQDRVTLDGAQQINGRITFEQDINVEGDLITPSINQIDLVDIVSVDSDEEQVMIGTKHFKESVHVDGSMELGNLHGTSFSLAHRAALFRDEDASISGNLVFGNPVTIEGDLQVDDTVNGMRMEDLTTRLRSPILRNVAQVRTIARTINETRNLLRARGDLSEFLYLEPVTELMPLGVTQTKRAIATDLGGGEVRVDVLGWELGNNCGLPSQCLCPVEYTLQVGNESLSRATWIRSNGTSRSFRLMEDPGHSSSLVVRVFTSTISTSSECRLTGERHLNEFTTIAWMSVNQMPFSLERFAEVTIDPSPILGYLSDAKLISTNGRTYVVLGLMYNVELDTTEVQSVLLRLDTSAQRAHVIGEFPTQGVTVLDVFYTSGGPHLVVGNSYASKSLSAQAHVDIYRFDSFSERLVPLRRIPTVGVVAVASVMHGGDSLIAIAQDQLFAPVLIFKHDVKINNYHFVQELAANSIPKGLNVFYIGQPGQSDAFLGVSTAEHLFYLYKYCHVEGFKLAMKIELQGVQGFTSFSVGNKQYLFFASSEKSSVFEVVKQS